MDGRNRLAALKRLGHESPLEANTKGIRYHKAIKRQGKRWLPDCDPVKFILSKNVYRRHLTPEQRRDAVARFIKADPKASDSSIAKALKVSDHTVADVRKESVPNSQNANLEHLPIERAKAAVRAANPGASVSAIAESASVSRGTAQRAQKLVAAESKPSTTKASQPKLEVIPANPSEDEVVADGVSKVRNRFVAACKEARRLRLSDVKIVEMVQEVLASR
jgi:hypothetical protein